jgi:chemotaxis signal transduction protein
VVTLETDTIEKVSHDGQDATNNFIFGIGKSGNELISLLDLNMVAMEK